MPPPTIDERGNRYGKLVVVALAGSESGRGGAVWECLCDCGTTTYVRGGHLRRGNTHSCGCGPRGGTTPHYGETLTLLAARRRRGRRRRGRKKSTT